MLRVVLVCDQFGADTYLQYLQEYQAPVFWWVHELSPKPSSVSSGPEEEGEKEEKGLPPPP